MTAAPPYPALRLAPGKDASLRRRHPFVFSGAVAQTDAGLADGDPVRLLAADGSVLGVGHYQSSGSIRARVLAFAPAALDAAFWERALAEAVALRERLGLLGGADTNACRLVHGEGDGLPGLIADYYAGHVVLQPHSRGMARALPEIADALRRVLGDRVGWVVGPEAAPGEPSGAEILEHGHRFRADWRAGQKTGFYLDQRENRRLVATLAAGRRVLNVFSYSGAFSVYALRGGAERVWSVDASRPAADWAVQHVRMNGLDASRHTAVTADALEYLKRVPEPYDLAILDPPAFAKHQSARHAAIQAYRRINHLALRQLAPGGLLVTFSCSQVVTPELFRGAVLAAAIDAGRPVRILYQLHQPPDHPVSLFHPEGEYLKGFVLGVA